MKNGLVALLFHEQGDVLEGIAVVQSVAGTENMVRVAGQIISEPHAWAKVLAIVACLFGHQGCRQRAERCCRLEFLESATVGNVRSSDEIVIPVPTKPKVHGQA